MQKILARLKVLECQMADILVFGDTHEQHDQRLEAVLKSIEGNGVMLNIENANLPGRKSNPSGSSSVRWNRGGSLEGRSDNADGGIDKYFGITSIPLNG